MLSQQTQVRTARMLMRLLREEDRAEFIRTHAVSAELYRPWFPAGVAGESLDDVFDREMSKATIGLREGMHVRMVGILPTARIGGFFNLSEIVRGAFQNAYASWSVSAEVAGQGYATEGVRALLDLAFTRLESGGAGLHRVQANIIPENERSIRLAERVGFRYEGLAERYLNIAGAWRDHRMYAKTAEEHDHPEPASVE